MHHLLAIAITQSAILLPCHVYVICNIVFIIHRKPSNQKVFGHQRPLIRLTTAVDPHLKVSCLSFGFDKKRRREE